MAFGYAPADIDEALKQIAEMSPEDRADLAREEGEASTDLDEGHLVAYGEECISESYEADKERRSKDDFLWRAHETEMAEMGDKEDWQSKLVLNTPFTTTMQAKSLIRRGLLERPEYFQLEPTDDKNPIYAMKAKFWDRALRYWTNTQDAYVPHVFADAAEMGYSVGLSQAIKIVWTPDENGIYHLKLVPIEPWKTFPDPDRKPRRTQSGLYNVHQEWVDFHILKAMEKTGYYKNIDDVRPSRESRGSTGARIEDQEEERKRRGKILQRNKYRKSVLVSEFWGDILNENGEIVMHNATFTFANSTLIRGPLPRPYRKLRWPWMDFAPIPHLLNFHGYGIYETVIGLWKFQNNLLNLFIDNENFRLNQEYVGNATALDDPSDIERYPGKIWWQKRGAQGPALTPLLKGDSVIQDLEVMWKLVDNQYETGSFITELLKGELGGRSQITLGEIQEKTQQALGVWDSFGKDTERGMAELLTAIKEVLTLFWDDFDRPNFRDIFGQDPMYQQMVMSGALSPDERIQALDLDCDIRARGVSRLLERSDVIQKLQALTQLSAQPMFQPYIIPYPIIRKFADELALPDMVMSPQAVQQQQEMQARTTRVSGMVQAALQASGAGEKSGGGAAGGPKGSGQPKPPSGSRRGPAQPPAGGKATPKRAAPPTTGPDVPTPAPM